MGVYIPGMEMPKDKAVAVVIHPDGTAYTAEMFAGVCTKYLADCEAVHVPPHGRLIDASESIRVEFYDEEHEDWTRHDMTIDDLLSQSWVDADAPTIIPAEPCNNLSKPCKEDEP